MAADVMNDFLREDFKAKVARKSLYWQQAHVTVVTKCLKAPGPDFIQNILRHHWNIFFF